MKKLFTVLLFVSFYLSAISQTLNGPSGFKVIDIGNNGVGDYTQSVILLHEMYNGTTIPYNNTVGTLTAFRGSQTSFNRINIANINTSSAYGETYGIIQSISNGPTWKLKTCIYNGKKYLAVDVPYHPAYHDLGFRFEGWVNSTGESLKCVNYTINGSPVNQGVLSNIQDFVPNLIQTIDVPQLNISGNVGIGTINPDAKLTVNGTIHSKEVKVDMNILPDYVFKPGYELLTLDEVKSYIDKNQHLPGVPSAEQVEKEGLKLGEMNVALLKKVEELTLYLLEKDKQDKQKQVQIDQLKRQVETLIKEIRKRK
jgi:hypothetical protein